MVHGTWYMDMSIAMAMSHSKLATKKQDRQEITQIETCIITTQDAKHDLCAASKTPTKKNGYHPVHRTSVTA